MRPGTRNPVAFGRCDFPALLTSAPKDSLRIRQADGPTVRTKRGCPRSRCRKVTTSGWHCRPRCSETARSICSTSGRGKTVIVITHGDRYFHCADQIVKLDFGRIAHAEPVSATHERCELGADAELCGVCGL